MAKSLDPLRIQLRALQIGRRSLESKLLQPRPMIAASLIERFLRAAGSQRTAPAYYLSRSHQGRSKLTYVKKGEVAVVRRQCEAYRDFQENLTSWRQLIAEMEELWKQLRQSQLK